MNECVVCKKECKGACCGGACRAKLSRRVRTVKSGARSDAHAKAHESEQSGTSALSTQTMASQEASESTKSDGPDVEQPDITLLPPGVSKPTGQRTTATANMTSQYLRTRVRYYKGTDWIASPEYAETIHRLLTLTLEELDAEGQFVPAWRLRQEPPQAAPVDEVKVEA